MLPWLPALFWLPELGVLALLPQLAKVSIMATASSMLILFFILYLLKVPCVLGPYSTDLLLALQLQSEKKAYAFFDYLPF